MIELAGVVIADECPGHILLLHRNMPDLQQWELPGGKVEPGEDPKQAAFREGEEELGIHARIIRRLGAAPFRHNGVDYFYHWFLATTKDEPRIVETETFDGLAFIHLGRFGIGAIGLSPSAINLARAIQNDEVRL